MALTCDFCGKDARDVQHMIAGKREAAICDACVQVCVEMLAELQAKNAAQSTKQIEASATEQGSQKGVPNA